MSIFKCKMCGGTIEFKQGASVGICDSCGTKQTLPKLDDERRANLYDRANHFRRGNEFDKAMGIYETILNEDPSDAEAYWSLVLCRYGIEYVDDPLTRKKIPTCHRTQFKSILEDTDYLTALQYADSIQHDLYEREAQYIDTVQKRILEISNKEKPFDINILKLIVEYFAELHSNFFGVENQKNIEWIKNNNFGEYIKEFTIQNFDKKKSYFISNNKKILTENIINIIKKINILELFEKINPNSEKNKNRTTLLHGDTQGGNLMINSEKNRMTMIDWQYINIGLGLKDIILFIGISLDEKNIKENDIQELKQYYYDLTSTNKGSYKVTCSDNKSKDYAWYDSDIDITNLPIGTYSLSVYTKTTDAADYGEVTDYFGILEDTTKTINNKKYTIRTNTSNNNRVEIVVEIVVE